MKKQAGLWIDHRKAVIVLLTGKVEEIKSISLEEERVSGTDSEKGWIEDVRDRHYENHLKSYYDEVIAVTRGSESILIFGPGEAKIELEKQFKHEGLAKSILAVETTDKMTVNQIAAKVRDRFKTEAE